MISVVKSKGEISQNFVAFSEYMNFTELLGEVSVVLGHPVLVKHPDNPRINKSTRTKVVQNIQTPLIILPCSSSGRNPLFPVMMFPSKTKRNC